MKLRTLMLSMRVWSMRPQLFALYGQKVQRVSASVSCENELNGVCFCFALVFGIKKNSHPLNFIVPLRVSSCLLLSGHELARS